jgi:hypothetical protein
LLLTAWQFGSTEGTAPKVAGKSLSSWLYLCRHGTAQEKAASYSAFREAGPSGVQFLQDQLKRHVFKEPHSIAKFFEKFQIRKSFNALAKTEQTLTILTFLGTNAQAATPQLIELVRLGEEPRLNVYATIAAVSPPSNEVIQILVDGLFTSDKKARGNAARALSAYGSAGRKGVAMILQLHRDAQSPSEREIFAQAVLAIDEVSAREAGIR